MRQPAPSCATTATHALYFQIQRSAPSSRVPTNLRSSEVSANEHDLDSGVFYLYFPSFLIRAFCPVPVVFLTGDGPFSRLCSTTAGRVRVPATVEAGTVLTCPRRPRDIGASAVRSSYLSPTCFVSILRIFGFLFCAVHCFFVSFLAWTAPRGWGYCCSDAERRGSPQRAFPWTDWRRYGACLLLPVLGWTARFLFLMRFAIALCAFFSVGARIRYGGSRHNLHRLGRARRVPWVAGERAAHGGE
ncbi:hypothetical protein C8J57DRAFT_390468 [Mycena rebaudengoi]|jgi:hypothetical protein|nr:hypothetical protein C8J57DRAFT_390468 [Mycena rebaudengoi]